MFANRHHIAARRTVTEGAGAPREPTWRLPAALFAVSVAVNYVWEVAQSPLYEGMERPGLVLWHCLLASLGDGLLVLLIFAAGRGVFGSRDWFERPGAGGYALMLAAGFVIATAVEAAALSLGSWEYKDSMPRLPGLGTGLAPLAQMLVLPPLVFFVVGRSRRKRAGAGATTEEQRR